MGRETESAKQQPRGIGKPVTSEPWANHGEPDHGKSGKCPELRDGHDVSAGVGIDLEIPGSMARVHVGSRVSKTRGNVERVAPWPPAVDGRHPSASRSRVGTPTREVWGVVECGWLREMLRCRRGLCTGNPPAGAQKAVLGGEGRGILQRVTRRS